MTTISGRVTDGRGNGIAGARIMVTAAPGAVPDTAMLTDADGRFVIGASVAGNYTLRAVTDEADGERTVRVDAEAAQEIEIPIGK